MESELRATTTSVSGGFMNKVNTVTFFVGNQRFDEINENVLNGFYKAIKNDGDWSIDLAAFVPDGGGTEEFYRLSKKGNNLFIEQVKTDED